MKEVVKPLDTRNEFQKAVDNLKFQLPSEIELINIRAKIAKAQYDSLLEQGFSEQQVMQIITTQPAWK